MTYNVLMGTLNRVKPYSLTHSLTQSMHVGDIGQTDKAHASHCTVTETMIQYEPKPTGSVCM